MADLKALMRIVDNEQERCSRILARYRTDAQFHAIVKRLAEWIQTAPIPIHSGDLRDACECAAMISKGEPLAQGFDFEQVEDFTIDLEGARQEWRGSTCGDCANWKPLAVNPPTPGTCEADDSSIVYPSTDPACGHFRPKAAAPACLTCAHWVPSSGDPLMGACGNPKIPIVDGFKSHHGTKCEAWEAAEFGMIQLRRGSIARFQRRQADQSGVIEFVTPPRMGKLEVMKRFSASMSAMGAAAAPVFAAAKQVNEQVEAMARAVMIPTASGKPLAELAEATRGIPPRPIVMDSFRPKSDPSTCSNCRHWQQRKRKGQRGKCPILGQLTKPSMGCTSWAAKDRDTCQNCANRDALQCRLSTASVMTTDTACDSFKPRSCSTCAHWAATDRSAMSAKCRHRLRAGWTMKHDARCEHWDRMPFREDDE